MDYQIEIRNIEAVRVAFFALHYRNSVSNQGGLK
jgi:hypothetical protein